MDARMDRRRFMRVGAASAAGVVALGGSLHGAAASGADTLAMLGGTPVRTEPFSQVWPIFDETEEQALLGALRSRDWCCLRGHEVYDYQTAFAQAMGAGQCVLSNGGTTALSACLHVLGVGPGDEVITTPRTFIATINVITNAHALPVFVDIDPETGSLDADLIEAAITEHTKVILPVHLAGYPVDIEKIMAIGKKHGIPVVEDACQSVFAEVNGKKVGTFGTGGCISFQEWKSLVCGEGGAILGDDPEFMRRCAAFVNNGRDPAGTLGGYPFPGSNHRMTEFQAAVLGQQFKRFITQDRTRQANGRYLEQRLTKIPGLSPRKRYTPNTRITYVEFDLDYDPEHFEGVPASLFARALRAEGISFVSGGRVGGAGAAIARVCWKSTSNPRPSADPTRPRGWRPIAGRWRTCPSWTVAFPAPSKGCRSTARSPSWARGGKWTKSSTPSPRSPGIVVHWPVCRTKGPEPMRFPSRR